MTDGTIVLTGATGFIGGEVLRRLLIRDRRPIVALVRAADRVAAAERGRATLEALVGPQGARACEARLRWVPADIEQPRLGLDRRTFDHLASTTTEIIHCAASTSFDLPLEEARRVNVAGVEGTLALAEAASLRGRFRRLHHVSTAYVAGKAPGPVRADDLPADDPALFRNTYERTKAEAERLLRAAMAHLPITVYRPSIVVGDSRTGRTTNWNVVYYPMRLMAWGRLPYASCGGPALLDVVPVDWVADAMLALGARDDTAGRTFHLTAGERALSVHDVIRETYAGMSRREGAPVPVRTRALGPVRWAALTAWARLVGGEKVRKALDGFAVYVDYTRCETVFAGGDEQALLAAAGCPLPDPARTFPRVVDYALAQNFGKPLREAAVTRRAPERPSLVERLASELRSASAASGIGPSPVLVQL